MLLMFDGKNRLLKEITVSTGSLSLNVVHPREVFKPAVRESAASVILLHNHPSGDPAPSPEDRELTRRLVKAGRIMGIKVLDHIVLGDGGYISFADQGWEVHD
jgi:DNA repair protein RadC